MVSAFYRAGFSSETSGKGLLPPGHGQKAGLTVSCSLRSLVTARVGPRGGKMWLQVLLTLLLCEFLFSSPVTLAS